MISVNVKFISDHTSNYVPAKFRTVTWTTRWVMTVLNDKDIIDFFMFDAKPTKRQIRLHKKEAMIRWNKSIPLV